MTLFGKIAKRWFWPLFLLLRSARLFLLALLVASGIVDVAVVATTA